VNFYIQLLHVHHNSIESYPELKKQIKQFYYYLEQQRDKLTKEQYKQIYITFFVIMHEKRENILKTMIRDTFTFRDIYTGYEYKYKNWFISNFYNSLLPEQLQDLRTDEQLKKKYLDESFTLFSQKWNEFRERQEREAKERQEREAKERQEREAKERQEKERQKKEAKERQEREAKERKRERAQSQLREITKIPQEIKFINNNTCKDYLHDDIYRMLLTKYKIVGSEIEYDIVGLLSYFYENKYRIPKKIREEIENIIINIIETMKTTLQINTEKNFKKIFTRCRLHQINDNTEFQDEISIILKFLTKVKDYINDKNTEIKKIDPNNYFTIENILP